MSSEESVPPLSTEQPAEAEAPEAAGVERALSTGQWLREGVRTGFLLLPRIGDCAPAPWQLGVIALLEIVVKLALARLQVSGPAVFDMQEWLAPWWGIAVMIFVTWALFGDAASRADVQPRAGGVAAWWTLWMAGALPVMVISQAVGIAVMREAVPWQIDPWFAWTLYYGLMAWAVMYSARLAWRFVPSLGKVAVFVIVYVGVTVITMTFSAGQPWHADYSSTADEERGPRFEPSQEIFEAQQQLLGRALASIKPAPAGGGHVYAVVFAPYDSDVFLHESDMVAQLLADRFDAKGRVLQLVNNDATTDKYPWATALNLRRAIFALAGTMDRERDVLVVYLTSHGAPDFKLAANHWPLAVAPLTPAALREALDQAGVKNRVIAISACYSGGWVTPLAGEGTLVMTAADSTHTSYGCGKRSPLTYFGRAVFDEQLRKTHSFEQAFAAAVPVIRQREIDGKKSDGFSNPQISVGEKIQPVLKQLEQRLDKAPAGSAPAKVS
jgi:hypothetical protein